MTAEIVITTKNAIVMAADSVVTVGGNKTYDGVNKLFMLSNDPPMGIMIFGTANFENIPLETLIKEFIKKTDFKDNGDIISIKESFLEYLGNAVPNSDFDLKIKHNLGLFRRTFVPKMCRFDEDGLIDFLESHKNDLPSFLKDYGDVIDKYDGEFKNMIPDDIGSSYHGKIISLLKNIFLNFILRNGTGVVIAGFNEVDMFPSLVSFNLSMNINNHVEIIDDDELINYDGCGIIPYAQKDVIYTFLTGIDLTMSESIVAYFNNFLINFFKEFKSEFDSNEHFNSDIREEIGKIFDSYIKGSDKRVDEFSQDIFDLKRKFFNPISISVNSLPKGELANIAEALIYITSLKRKIDSNLETVGGDIDVAIISKGDGFIWKNKKQYFNKELNPHFREINNI